MDRRHSPDRQFGSQRWRLSEGALRLRQLIFFALAPAAAMWILSGPLIAAEMPAETRTNRLIHSGSPYLLQHAHNPVDWYPWGEEAFAKAKKENKLIFLSVGYSTCYWCHVAERTIYSNPAIAALMNRWFVNIRAEPASRGTASAAPNEVSFEVIASR